jgi:hypothetical protein
MVKLLRALQEAPPSEEEMVAQLIAAMTLNRPPDPVWCPDPLMIDSGWNDALTDPAEEFVLAVQDPANEVHEVAFDQWAVLETATTPDETLGTDTLGPETVGPETVGPETVGPETVGPETVGPETVGPETVGAKLAVAPAVETLDVEKTDGAST